MPGQLQNYMDFVTNNGYTSHFVVAFDGTVTQFVPTRRNTMSKFDRLMKQAEELMEQAAKLAARPEEPSVDDDACVVWFRKKFTDYSQAYTYAAVKVVIPGRARALWYLSGSKNACQGVTWEVLCDFIFKSYEDGDTTFVPELWLATSWEVLD